MDERVDLVVSLPVDRPGPWPDDAAVMVDALRVYAAVLETVGFAPSDYGSALKNSRAAKRANELREGIEGAVEAQLAKRKGPRADRAPGVA